MNPQELRARLLAGHPSAEREEVCWLDLGVHLRFTGTPEGR